MKTLGLSVFTAVSCISLCPHLFSTHPACWSLTLTPTLSCQIFTRATRSWETEHTPVLQQQARMWSWFCIHPSLHLCWRSSEWGGGSVQVRTDMEHTGCVNVNCFSEVINWRASCAPEHSCWHLKMDESPQWDTETPQCPRRPRLTLPVSMLTFLWCMWATTCWHYL